MKGMQHDGRHYFSFNGDSPSFWSSGSRTLIGAYDPADNIKPMRLSVEAWKSRDVREIERQFIRTGRRLAKYGDYSGAFGMRGWVQASSDAGGATVFSAGSVLFDTENGRSTHEKIGTLDGFMQH
ncbi:MAG: hypothetical protein H0X66_14935 [Verrucomicrobia bacterium]|nr:hypothetical protein [Verrucomicrobiota bacterium]